ncbi:MAG: lycopene cyclase family protein [bacterium]|nr:lycopene cyclase family protein [bacterium]
MSEHYDYIIAGAGAAGLSLACNMVDGALSGARILLIDQNLKQSNDRTWCYWSDEADDLEHLVYKSWSHLSFLNEAHQHGGDLGRLTYKMIRGEDFYAHAWAKLRNCPNVSFRQERVLHYHPTANGAGVVTDRATYTGRYIFNSCMLPKPDPGSHFLLQHFAGWWIETEMPSFDPQKGYLMDFRTPQKGSTRFFYLLPIDERRALVEYTVFSPSRLHAAEYQSELKTYVEQLLGILHYTITEYESGAIPMTDQIMPKQMYPNVINIGTAGGAVKPTTGYAFSRIRRQAAQVCAQLESGQYPDSTVKSPGRFRFYDRLLLNILQTRGDLGKGIFSSLFRYTPIETIFRFLAEGTKLQQEARIFLRLPVPTFLKAVWRVFGPVKEATEQKAAEAKEQPPVAWAIPVEDKLQTP